MASSELFPRPLVVGSPTHQAAAAAVAAAAVATVAMTPELSDEDDEEVEAMATAAGAGNGVHLASVAAASPSPTLTGTLSKWTNYIHGWQDRYFALKADGSLVYYKSANDTDFGCRGAISIQKAQVKAHELDELRFDVSVNDCNWYLRAQSADDRQMWIDSLETHKQQHQNQSSNQPLYRHGSLHSLSSFSNSSSRLCSAKGRGLAEKLAEMETFRDILCRQVDTLQSYFDSCSEVISQNLEDIAASSSSSTFVTKDILLQHGLQAVDFKGEAITFKATTAGILATLNHCIELMNQREESWRRKVEREQQARKVAEEKYRNAIEFAQPATVETAADTSASSSLLLRHQPPPTHPHKSLPDYEEGPHSQMGEDEFFDAVENALDKLEEEQTTIDRLKRIELEQRPASGAAWEVEEATMRHPLWPEIDRVTKEQLHYARLIPGQDGVWELFAEEGEMKMYKREEEEDGMVVDPLKALHTVRGVTARELCHHFFSPDVRMEWETTLDQASVLEKVSNDTLLFLQLHKRIWPAAQRDSCFWSHLRQIKSGDLKPEDAVDTYLVCNKSLIDGHPDAPAAGTDGILRVDLTVIFVCDTIVVKKDFNGDLNSLARSDLACRITYCSVVNPGGWAPASVLRTVYKREYPRFLKRFTSYVIEKCKKKPIMW